MALLFCDGFDHVDDGYENLKWSYVSSTFAVDYASGYGRTGGYGIKISPINVTVYTTIANTATFVFGAAFKLSGADGTYKKFVLGDGSSEQLGLYINTAGAVVLTRGGSQIDISTSGLVSFDTWYYIEIKATINNSTGTAEVRLNGSSSPIINFSGDTQATGNAYINRIDLFVYNTTLYVDDLYICDTTGSTCNDFLGDVTITTLYPTADGTHTDFTPSTGTDHYALVDEAQISGATDYNESSTVGHKDSYDVTTFSGSGTIHAVQVTAAVLNPDTGTMTVKPFTRVNSTDYEGSEFSLSQTMKAAMSIWEVNPDDSAAWEAADINGAEFGLKVQS